MSAIGKKLRQQCAKQTTVAIIMKNKKVIAIGTNWINIIQKECPRKNMPSGKGYELCKTICKQPYHAEVDACVQAGKRAEGGTLYLIGHTYSCENCKQVMRAHGIAELVLCESGETVILA